MIDFPLLAAFTRTCLMLSFRAETRASEEEIEISVSLPDGLITWRVPKMAEKYFAHLPRVDGFPTISMPSEFRARQLEDFARRRDTKRMTAVRE
jgi:hypothetical protein